MNTLTPASIVVVALCLGCSTQKPATPEEGTAPETTSSEAAAEERVAPREAAEPAAPTTPSVADVGPDAMDDDDDEEDLAEPNTPLDVVFASKADTSIADAVAGTPKGTPDDAKWTAEQRAVARSIRAFDMALRDETQEVTSLVRGRAFRLTSTDEADEAGEEPTTRKVSVKKGARLYMSDCFNVGAYDVAVCHGACCAFGMFDALSAFGASHNTVHVERVCFDTSSTKREVLPVTSVDVHLDQCDAAVSGRD